MPEYLKHEQLDRDIYYIASCRFWANYYGDKGFDYWDRAIARREEESKAWQDIFANRSSRLIPTEEQIAEKLAHLTEVYKKTTPED